MIAWESFKGGDAWGGERLSPKNLLAWFADTGGARAVTVSAVIGLRHHARVRDAVTAPALDVWPRLLAAETVLAAALAGTPLDEAWVEEAVRRQQREEERGAEREAEAAAKEEARARLRETLLDPEKRRAYILEELMPLARANPRSRSLWQDTFDLFAKAWKEAGLPEHERPHADGRTLSKAFHQAKSRQSE
jgi:hypothetical protein